MQRTPAMRVLVPALLVAISALSGCGKSEAPPPAQTPEVGIVTLEAQTVTLNTELPGRTNAFRIAEVRPQVNGIILKRLFKEGSDVKAGQQLYQIDPATYEADYQSAQANLASTQEQAQRYKLLVADQAVSKQQYADANAAYLQSKAAVEQARMNPDDLSKWYVRNDKGEMVPFNAFATGKWEYGSPKLERYNGVPAMEILGEPAPGLSSGDAMAAVEEIVKQLPKGVGYSWTGLSYEERLSGSQAPALYALSLLVVFLCLAALYESWSIPFSVMLVVPLGVIGALLATSMRGLSNDVFFQVGLLTTIGLSAKNAILIVEFAKELHEQGKGIVEAAIEACRMRLRPIVMTSLAFILGVVPLAISTGAGSGSQHAIGTGVIGGMVTATVLAIFWVPLFYVAVSTLFKDEASKQQASVEKGQ